jgi:hypothetical protein
MKISALMMCLLLAGCASTHNKGNPTASSDGAMNSSDDGATSASTSGSSSSGALNSSNASGSSTMNSSGASGASTTGSSAQSWNGVVVSIDRLDSSMAAGGATGAMAGGAAMGGYRVTVRKDDGATDTVVVSNLPAYRTGDKVSYRNGTLSPQQQQ